MMNYCSWSEVAEGLRCLSPALPLLALFTPVRGREILGSCASPCNRSYSPSLYNAVELTRPTLFREKGVKDTSRSASYVLLSVVALMMVMLAMSVALLSPRGVRSLVVNSETFGFPKESLQRVPASMASVRRMALSA